MQNFLITRLSATSFQVAIEGANEALQLEFAAFIDLHDLDNNFVLCHCIEIAGTQRFGFFTSDDNQTDYRIIEGWNLLQSASLVDFVQLVKCQTIPTACMLFQDARLVDRGDGLFRLLPTNTDDIVNFILNPPVHRLRLARPSSVGMLGVGLTDFDDYDPM